MSLLDTFTPLGWAKAALAVAVVGLLVGAYTTQHVEILSLRAGLAAEKQGRAEDSLAVAARDRNALAQKVADDQRITDARKKADDENAAQLASARADRVNADAATARLQQRFAAAIAAASRPRSSDPAAVASSASTPAADLPTDMFGGVVEACRQYRDAAESAFTAGELAESEYDALKEPTGLGKPKPGD